MNLLAIAAALLCSEGVPAFPGAEGYGASTPGGRGGRVIFVDNLQDSGPGSLRTAIDASGPRLVVFRTSGLISLEKPLIIRNPFITIAGQTAPGSGICLRGASLIVATQDVVIRHLRSRIGDVRGEADAISIATPSRRVILDHVSASWSTDESLSPSGDIADVTVQWSFITESLNASVHSKGNHGYGTLARATGGVTFHHNLWAHHNGRNPRFGDNYGKGGPAFYDFRNNVLYNWGAYASGLVDGNIRVNYIANFLRYGPSSSRRVPIHMGEAANAETQFFVWDNLVDGREELTGLQLFDRPTRLAQTPFPAPPVKTTTARQAFEDVLLDAGATKPQRDSVDSRIVATVREGTGRIIDKPADAGGWPVYEAGTPPRDSDHDGIPDSWEIRNKLDPRHAADANRLSPGGIYTWIEEYLNELGASSPSHRKP